MSMIANGNANHFESATRDASVLHEIATQLRIDSVQATTAAGSGLLTSCASAVEIMTILIFEVMRQDVRLPRVPQNDVSALSLEHCAVHKLAVRQFPHCEKSHELLDYYGMASDRAASLQQ